MTQTEILKMMFKLQLDATELGKIKKYKFIDLLQTIHMKQKCLRELQKN